MGEENMDTVNKFDFRALPLEIAIKILKDVPLEKIPQDIFETPYGAELIRDNYRTTEKYDDVLKCRELIIKIEKSLLSQNDLGDFGSMYAYAVVEHDLDKLLLKILRRDKTSGNKISNFVQGCVRATVEYENISMYKLICNIEFNQYWKKHYNEYCDWGYDTIEAIQKLWTSYVIDKDKFHLFEKIPPSKMILTEALSKYMEVKYNRCISHNLSTYIIANIKNVDWSYTEKTSRNLYARKFVLAKRLSWLQDTYHVVCAIHENEDIFNDERNKDIQNIGSREEFYMKELMISGQVETFKYMFETVKYPVEEERAEVMMTAIMNGHHEWVTWASDKDQWKDMNIGFVAPKERGDYFSISCVYEKTLCYKMSKDMISALCTQYKIDDWTGVVRYATEYSIDLREILPPHMIYNDVGKAIAEMLFSTRSKYVNYKTMDFLSIPFQNDINPFENEDTLKIYTHMCDLEAFELLLFMSREKTIRCFLCTRQCYPYTVFTEEKMNMIGNFLCNQDPEEVMFRNPECEMIKNNVKWFCDMALEKKSWAHIGKFFECPYTSEIMYESFRSFGYHHESDTRVVDWSEIFEHMENPCFCGGVLNNVFWDTCKDKGTFSKMIKYKFLTTYGSDTFTPNDDQIDAILDIDKENGDNKLKLAILENIRNVNIVNYVLYKTIKPRESSWPANEYKRFVQLDKLDCGDGYILGIDKLDEILQSINDTRYEYIQKLVRAHARKHDNNKWVENYNIAKAYMSVFRQENKLNIKSLPHDEIILAAAITSKHKNILKHFVKNGYIVPDTFSYKKYEPAIGDEMSFVSKNCDIIQILSFNGDTKTLKYILKMISDPHEKKYENGKHPVVLAKNKKTRKILFDFGFSIDPLVHAAHKYFIHNFSTRFEEIKKNILALVDEGVIDKEELSGRVTSIHKEDGYVWIFMCKNNLDADILEIISDTCLEKSSFQANMGDGAGAIKLWISYIEDFLEYSKSKKVRHLLEHMWIEFEQFIATHDLHLTWLEILRQRQFSERLGNAIGCELSIISQDFRRNNSNSFSSHGNCRMKFKYRQ